MTPLPHQARGPVQARPHQPGVSVSEHVNRLLQEMDLRHQQRYEQRVDALERLLDAKILLLRTVIDSQADRAELALAAADKAISKGEVATEKRFESVNEFRLTLSDQTKSFITRVEFEALRESNATRIADLLSRLDRTDGKAVGLNAGWLYLLGALSATGTVVSILIAVFLS